MHKNLKHLFLVSLVVLNGCAGQRAATGDAPLAATRADGKVDKLAVIYTQSFPDGSRLKDKPEEIMIVRSANTQKNVAAQTALGILTFALGGGVGFSGFSKESLKGDKIEEVKDRANLRNPVPTDFTTQLREQINVSASANVDTKPGVAYKHVVNVAGGNTRLIYESLTGEEADQYRMNTELVVYKKKERAGMFTADPYVRVYCDRISEKALPLDDWAKDDYAMAHQWLDETLRQCSDKVIAALPLLLAR